MKFLKLIRPQNLIIIALVMIIIKYGYFEKIGIETALSFFQFALLIFASLFIAAGGYVINDIYDVETDRINRPHTLLIGVHISTKNADYVYILLTSIGVILGVILSNLIGFKELSILFVIIAALLYGYATTFKNIFFIGNVLIAGLVAFTPLLLVLFDIYPTIGASIERPSLIASTTIVHFALFAFCINLIRELIKDIQDINGDKNAGRNTIPIILGQKRSIHITFFFNIVLVVATIYYLYAYLYYSKLLMLYFLITVTGPLIYLNVKIFNAEKSQDFKHISTILKVVMLTGMCTLLFIPYY